MGNSLTVLPRLLVETKVRGKKSKKENGQGLNWWDLAGSQISNLLFEIHYL